VALVTPRHRHQEWLAFLRKIDQAIAPELELHIICDNYATHKHAKVIGWLKRHPRFHLHPPASEAATRVRLLQGVLQQGKCAFLRIGEGLSELDT
jgi:hypothetical protein